MNDIFKKNWTAYWNNPLIRRFINPGRKDFLQRNADASIIVSANQVTPDQQHIIDPTDGRRLDFNRGDWRVLRLTPQELLDGVNVINNELYDHLDDQIIQYTDYPVMFKGQDRWQAITKYDLDLYNDKRQYQQLPDCPYIPQDRWRADRVAMRSHEIIPQVHSTSIPRANNPQGISWIWDAGERTEISGATKQEIKFPWS